MMHVDTPCYLCFRHVKLCNSHIIPEFFYEQMKLYDDIHRFNILSTEPSRYPFAQKGLSEKLLCKKCEDKFSRWESYARKVLYGGECIKITKNTLEGPEIIVDYTKFKLFQLSILWRIGVSTLKAFSSITLGKHEPILRKMLLEEKPGSTETYGLIVLHSSKYKDITSNLIHCMGMVDVEDVTCARLLLGGCFWFFLLSERVIDPVLSALFLQETGNFKILWAREELGQYIECLAKDIVKANPAHFNHFNK